MATWRGSRREEGGHKADPLVPLLLIFVLSCIAGRIHEDIQLAQCKSDGETRPRMIPHSLEISMDFVVRVEVVETFRNIG